MPTPQHFNLSTWTIIRFLGILLILGIIYICRDIVTALIFAIIVASAVEPAIEWLKERKVPRILGAILIYIFIAAIFFFLIYLIIPLIFDELRNISLTYPVLQEQISSGLNRVSGPLVPFIDIKFDNLFDIPTNYLGSIKGDIVSFASAVFGGVFSFLLIVIFSFYIATQERGIESFLRMVTPAAQEPYIIDLWDRSQKKLGRWLRAQLLLGAVVGVLIFFGLTFLGVRHAMIFGVLSAIFEIIPVVGPILAAVPGVGVAFISSTLTGLLATVLYIVVQQLESHVIVPVVMRKTIGLSPLVVVLALLVGAKIGGIFGILLAVPIATIVAELVADLEKKKRVLIPE